MKPLYVVPALLLALLGCQSATHSSSSTVSATSASNLPPAASTPASVEATFNTNAQAVCEQENELGYQISGPLTASQQTQLASDNVALTHAGDLTLTRIVATNMAPTTAGLSNILAACAMLGYIPSAAPIETVAPAPVIPTASAGTGLNFADLGVGIGISPSIASASMDGGFLRPANGHFVAVVVYATAFQRVTVTSGDFYVRTTDGGHYDPSFAVNMKPAQLTFVTLNSGEKANGTLVFDLPVTTGFQLIYAPQSNILGVWQY